MRRPPDESRKGNRAGWRRKLGTPCAQAHAASGQSRHPVTRHDSTHKGALTTASSEKPPEVEPLAELNERFAAIDAAEDARHVHGRPTSIGFDFEQERPLLRPIPADGYDCGIDLTPVVHRNGG